MRIADELKTKYMQVPNVSDLKEMIYASAARYGKKAAFEVKDSTGKIVKIGYDKLKQDVISLGTSLLNLGLKGKAIGVVGKNSYSWVVSYLASCIIGIVVPIDKELHTDDVINFLNISEAKCLIGDTKFLNPVFEAKANLKEPDFTFVDIQSKNSNYLSFATLLEDGKKSFDNGNLEFDKIQVNPDELHILLFTSGTTGKAKGVCLCHKNIVSNVMSIASIVKVDTSTRVLSILPIHHTYECTIGNMLVLYGGGTVTFCDGLKYITKNINEYKPNFILCVPLLLENVHKKINKVMAKSLPKYYKEGTNIIDNLPFFMKPIVKYKIKKSLGGNLGTFIVGAAAVNPVIVEDFVKYGIRVLQGYGLTECSPLVAGNNDFFYKADSAGLPIPNVEYKIDEPNEEGIGQIIVKGPNVMLGYYKNEVETNKVLKDGWFYTGDLGKIDENGYLYITGRCKSVIVTKNGKNIYPEELEYYLNDNPLISEAVVVGVNHEGDDETYVNAIIYPNKEAICEYLGKEEVSSEDIQKLMNHIVQDVNKKFPNYKHIKGIKIRDTEFEKTTTQKIKRFGDNLKI